MPAGAFNFHDDFHSYLDLPLQILQTGSFQENPFPAIGLLTLGGQSFMQCFSQLFFDIRYINVFDAIICLALGLGVLVEFGKKINSGFATILVSLVLYLFINPMYVNISALYSGSLMILGLAVSSHWLREFCNDRKFSQKKAILAAMPVAIFSAALVTLKTTFIFFPFFYILICLACDMVFLKKKKLMLSANLTSALAATLLLIPWIAISFAQLAPVVRKIGDSALSGTAHSFGPSKFSAVFSTHKIFWGNSFPDYLMILGVLAFFCLAISYWLIKRPEDLPYHECMPMICTAAACIACFLSFFSFFFSPQSLIRYLTPIMVAVLPFTTLLVGRFAQNGAAACDTQALPRSLKKIMFLIFALHLVITGTFLGTFIDRVKRIESQRMMLSFPVNNDYLFSVKTALNKERGKKIRKVQAVTEKGAKILAWISTPFDLDFARNSILVLKTLPPGIPARAGSDTLLRFFIGKGIRYIMWEYKGFGVKSKEYYLKNYEQEEFIYLINALSDLAHKTKVVYHQDSIIVLDIGEL